MGGDIMASAMKQMATKMKLTFRTIVIRQSDCVGDTYGGGYIVMKILRDRKSVV